MRTEEQIKEMLKRSNALDGIVSPSAISALEWVLEVAGGNEFDVFMERQ